MARGEEGEMARRDSDKREQPKQQEHAIMRKKGIRVARFGGMSRERDDFRPVVVSQEYVLCR